MKDILGELLSGHQETVPDTARLDRLIRGEMTTRLREAQADEVLSGEAPRPVKIKATHYLSEEIAEQLDEAKKIVSEMLPNDLKNRVSKSQIVNISVQMVLLEFEKRGKESLLIKHILRKAGYEAKN